MRFMLAFLLLFTLVNSGFAWVSFMSGKKQYGNYSEPTLSTFQNVLREQWFTQYVDHFNQADGRTWKQRYYMNSAYYRKGGPVFLFIGGESAVYYSSMMGTSIIEYAKQFGALYFLLEHRYYGKSQPLPDLSVKNLAYLSADQALADLANFIKGMNTQLSGDTKWIAFGGSYAGSLAAWLRFKYPDLVHGAVSSSAPLLAQVDFQQYFVVVENSLKTHSQACVNAIATATKQVDMMLRSVSGRNALEQLFDLCGPISSGATSKKDISGLYQQLAFILAVTVQYHGDNSIENIDYTCNIMVNENYGDPVRRLAVIVREFNAGQCLNCNYDAMINYYQSIITWKEKNLVRQWLYQTCTEFGFFQTSTAVTHMFGDNFPVEYFLQQCADIFGSRFKNTATEGAARINKLYKALDLVNLVTNVVFLHGSLDPWHALGIIKSKNPEAPVIFIDGVSHCADMVRSTAYDSPQLIKARESVKQLIKRWLNGN